MFDTKSIFLDVRPVWNLDCRKDTPACRLDSSWAPFEIPYKTLCFCIAARGSGRDSASAEFPLFSRPQNLTISTKPFKKLVKTNNFTIRSMEVPDHAAERGRRRTEASWRPWQESGSASAPPHTYQVSKRAFWESPRTAGWHGGVDTVLYWGPEGGEGGTRNV